MKNKKRYTFQCWNCAQTYTLQREITAEQIWIVACPYCQKEAVVQLQPYKKPKATSIFRGDGPEDGPDLAQYDLPEVIPTAAREA